GWVSQDQKAVRRALAIRTGALSAIIVATLGGAAAVGYSYWKNLQLVRMAEPQTAAYQRAAAEELDREVITDTDLRPVVPLLNMVSSMPAGYGDSEQDSFWEGLGLGQRERLNRVATESYAEALER